MVPLNGKKKLVLAIRVSQNYFKKFKLGDTTLASPPPPPLREQAGSAYGKRIGLID